QTETKAMGTDSRNSAGNCGCHWCFYLPVTPIDRYWYRWWKYGIDADQPFCVKCSNACEPYDMGQCWNRWATKDIGISKGRITVASAWTTRYARILLYGRRILPILCR